MLTAEQLRASVDLYTGACAFPLTLASLPGRNGLEVSLVARYAGNVRRQAATWNLDAPTGVLGLGWSLSLDAVVALRDGTAADPPAGYALVSPSGTTRLFRTGTADDGTHSYAAEAYEFWQIRHDPGRQTWTVVRDNGDVWIYGDPASGAGAVEWGVAWGAWADASARVDGQAAVATVWRLARVGNRWGDEVRYTYTQETVQVGPPTTSGARVAYTRACYLSRIDGVAGDALVLGYTEKQPFESPEPHTAPPAPNAWQDRWDTGCLSTVTVLAADGTTLRTVTLGYGDGQGGTAFVGATDALKKRLLTSVHSSSAGGEALPGVRFSYYGQPGVTPAGPAGSLAAVMVPEGGITAFTYAEQTPALSSRDVALARPSAQGTAGAPRFAFADAYAVAVWPMTGPDSLQVAAYTWQGRWIERWLDAVAGGGSGYDASPVVTSGDFFALRSGAKLYLPHLDPWQVGEWARPSADGNPYFTLPLAAGEAAQVGVGDAFAAVLGQTGGTLSTFRWTGQAWAADAALTLAAGSTPAAFALAARGDWLLAAATASSAGDDPVHLRLAWLDGTGRWQGSTFQAARPTSIVSSLSLFAGDTFAVEKTVWSGATGTTAVYRAHRWSADRARLYTDPLLCVNLAVGADAPDPVVAGSTVAVGMQLFRWDGGAWVTADLGSPGVPTGATVQGAAYGPDLVLRTVRASGNGDYTADLLAYDPNTSAWSVKSSSTGAAAGATLAARTGGARSRYALLRGALLFQDPDGSWAGTFSLPSTADAASAQLLGERYLVAQDGADAAVWPLANGGVASATALKVLNARVSIPSSSPAALVGGEAFVTFTGAFGDADSALRLHRVVNGGVEGEQAVQAVTLLQESDGYQTVSTAYGYAAASATVGGGEGDGGRYGTVSTVPGSADATQQPNGRTDQRFFNGLTAHEATAAGVTYPTDSASTNATRYTARVAGLPYGTAVYPAGSNPGAVAGTLAYWYVTPVALGGLGAGAYARPLRGDRAQDGVTSRVELAFSATTGMLNRVATHSWDIDGNPRTEVEERSYACELYPAMAAANLLTSIAKLTTRAIGPSGGAGTVTGSAVTTWREDWGHGAGQWAPYRGYAATAADDAFSAWGAGDPPPSSGWAEQRTVLARDGWGLALEARGTAGVRSSWIHDTAGMVPLAAFTNTARADASYYDFEPYAAPGAWAWSAAGSTLAAHVTTADYHTGSRSLELPPTPGEKAGPLLQWIPADQAARYLFSCWAATDAGFDPAQGAAAWEIGVYRGDTGARLATLDLALGATAGAWAPFQRVIDLGGVRAAAGSGLPAAVPLQVRLLGYNANASVACRVDNLRVSRLDAAFAAAVYDARTLRPLSTLGANGDTLTTVYDGQGRAVASVGPGERVNRVWAPSLSRQLTRADRFLPDFPNSLLRLATSARSAWKDFRAAGAAREWSFGGTGSWSVAGGELKHTGAAGGLPLGGTATFTAWAMTSFALRVTARRDGAGNAGAGNGDVIVYWDDAAGAWTLARRAGDGTVTTVSTSTALGWRGDWVYAVVDGLVLFYAGGVQLFAYDGAPDTAAPDYGKPLLVMSGTGAFDDVAILDDPQLTLDFSTGTGLPFQGVALEGRSAPYPAAGDFRSVSGGVFVDALGRVAAGRRPLSVPLVIAPPTTGGLPALPGGFGGEEPSDGSGGGGDDATALELVEGGALTYLAAPDGTPWSKATYLAGGYGGGYDYVQPTYESSPLSRVVELLLPRAQAADPASARYTTAYLCNTAAGDGSVMNDLLPPGTPDGRYFITRSTGPDGTRRWELADAAGRALAARVDLGAGTYLTTGWAYDDAGRVTAILPPNHYAEADAARKAEWDTTLEYDFQARLTATTSPDAGETRFLYDASGVLRFRMDAEGAAQSPQRVVYRRLDALGRVVEEGWIAQPWSALAAHVDDPAWPTVGTGAGEVPGAWTRRMTYDWTGTTPPDGLPDEPNLVGRLWRVRVARGESAFTETYAYDAAGNVVEHLAAEGDATAQRTSYLYDNQDRLQRLTYPRADGSPDGDAVRVAYFYDRLARLASIGRPPAGTEVIDPENPATGDEQAYAAYTYDRMGRLVRETLAAGWSKPFTRAYGYTQAGFLSRIDDPFLAQALDYTGGADGAGYHDGRIARLSTAYPPEGWELCPPADWDVRLAYDAAGRLTAARNGASDAWSWAAPGPDAYDANGNPLTLRRGAAQQSFAYPAGSAKRGNRVLSLTATADTTLPLAGGAPAPADAWWWGSGNGGPSASAVAQDGEKGTVLRLAGGSPGHFETVRLRSWLDPAGRYTVTCSVRTDAGFGAAPGSAAWMLSVESPSRPAATIRVGTVADTAGAWSDVSFEVDVAARLAELAPGAEAGSITLQLVNYRTSATGSGAGPGLEVTPIRVRSTAPVQGGDIGYDRDGRTTALPSRGLSTLSYDAVSGLTTGLALAGGQTLELAYGGRGQRTAKTLRDRAGAALATTTWAYGADARPLAQQGEDTELRYLYGPGGVVAVLQGDAAGFVLRDHLGSVRGMVDPAAGTATAARDYLVFGGAMRSRGDVPGGRLFTGQPLDAETGLYDYGARFYDPALGRFLATDPAGEGAGPYTYAGNDPVAFTDPDGEMRLFYLGALGAGVAVGLGGAVGTARLWWQYVTAPAAMAFREAAERIPTGAGLYSNATRAALDLSAAELGIEPLPVRPDSTFTDYLKGKTYDPANFAAYRVTGGAGGLALQNGTRLADGRYIYTLDENYELRMLRGEPPPQNGTKWEQLRSHPQLSGGKRVILAGWAQVENGEITGMDVASGHYQPLALYLSFAREVLRALGIRAGRLRLCTFENSLQFTDKACIPAREDQCAPRQLRPEGEIEYLQPENWKVAPKVRIQRFLVTTLGYTPRQVAESWIFGWNLGPFSVRPKGGTYMQFPEEAWQLPW